MFHTLYNAYEVIVVIHFTIGKIQSLHLEINQPILKIEFKGIIYF